MKTGYKKSNPTKGVAKGYAKDVNVVNTPTVKISHEKPDEHKPTLCLTSKDLAAIKNWKTGAKYRLVLEVEQTGQRKGDYGMVSDSGESDRFSADLKVLNVKEA